MATNWQQLGPVKAKVVGDKTLVTQYEADFGWDVAICSKLGTDVLENYYTTEAAAMAAADAIYDPPAKKIEAADRGEYGSFWRSEDGKRAAMVRRRVNCWVVSISDAGAVFCDSEDEAELAAAKYVGGEGS